MYMFSTAFHVKNHILFTRFNIKRAWTEFDGREEMQKEARETENIILRPHRLVLKIGT